MVLEHGGRLREAARKYSIPLSEWLDLSTGISPWSWPVPVIPDSVWRRLPEADDELESVARRWAGVPENAACLPVAGSQAAIQCLPRLRDPGRVGIVRPGYAEHAHCWAQAGHELVPVTSDSVDEVLDELDVLVWIHPNNPTGQVLPRETLLAWRQRLAARGGCLVVDEAFIEASEAASLVPDTGEEGLIVLRSIGKFFGLAGIRGGLVMAEPGLIDRLVALLGPWAVAGPTRWIMQQALADTAWQRRQKQRLADASTALRSTLESAGLPLTGGTDLFQFTLTEEATTIQESLASHGVLVRCFKEPRALRFGLPGEKDALLRLQFLLSGL